ncbi:hypothetical protein D3C76_1427290 [compost metagenome]
MIEIDQRALDGRLGCDFSTRMEHGIEGEGDDGDITGGGDVGDDDKDGGDKQDGGVVGRRCESCRGRQ